MFDLIHKRKRLAQIVLVVLVIPFAFFGLESYTRLSGGRDDVATVNGSPITQAEFAEMFGMRGSDPETASVPSA